MIKLIWHEKSNFLAVCETSSGLPRLTILDDEYMGLNPFYGYSLDLLTEICGWIVLGEL